MARFAMARRVRAHAVMASAWHWLGESRSPRPMDVSMPSL